MVSNHEIKSWFQIMKPNHGFNTVRISVVPTVGGLESRKHSPRCPGPNNSLSPCCSNFCVGHLGKGSSKALTEFRGQGSSHWANSGEALAGLAQFSGSICSVWSNSEELVLAQTMRISRIGWVCLVPREQIMKPNHETKS